jgi:quercetin dioxygenase-like cupin family protein
MIHRFHARLAVLLIGGVGIGAAVVAAPLGSKLVMTAQQVKYMENPDLPGMMVSQPIGDYSQKGTYVLRNKLPPNFMMPPHKHGESRILTVLEGTLYFEYAKNLDESQLKAYGPGSLIVEPKGEWHILLTKKEGVTYQVIAEGPMTTVFDLPSK